MATTQVLTKIGVLAGSFLVGLLFFYMTTLSTKETKKQQVDMVASQLINFVIFIWIGKVIFHLKLFIQDPLAVLAYPSNSSAFYIASLLFLLMISYQSIRKKINLRLFITAFVPIFLAASFVYEFIQLTVYEVDSLFHLALLMILLIAYLLGMKQYTSQLILLTFWATGLIVISFFMPFITLFGFMLSHYFLLGTIVFCMALYFYNKRKQVT